MPVWYCWMLAVSCWMSVLSQIPMQTYSALRPRIVSLSLVAILRFLSAVMPQPAHRLLYMKGSHAHLWNLQPLLTLVSYPFSGLFSRTAWVSRRQKGWTNLILIRKRWWGGSEFSFTICRSFAPWYKVIITPASHHSIFRSIHTYVRPFTKSFSDFIWFGVWVDLHRICA